MTFIRTVLGDIEPEDLGPTYAHEHLVIAGGRPVELFPDFRLDSVADAVAELAPARALGLGAVVDAMPCDAGRDATRLAAISRESGIHVIAPTGLHHERYYDDGHWSVRLGAGAIAELFIADITDGIDAHDYAGPAVDRTQHRAGVIKVAGSHNGPSPRDEPIFEAAAIAHLATGAPILTHCEEGTGALEQLALLARHGVSARHVTLSHVDKVRDLGYQRELAASGATLEYDQAIRSPADPNPTLELTVAMVEADLGASIVLGHDAARRSYWTVHGGAPGLAYLLGPFREALLARGLEVAIVDAFFVVNPARAFAFAPVGVEVAP